MNIAHLKEDSIFRRVFPNGCVPILNILLPNQAICEGSNERGTAEDVYMVDLDKLSEDKFEKLARRVHEQCDPGYPFDACKREIRERGLPMRAKHVATVSSDSRYFL